MKQKSVLITLLTALLLISCSGDKPAVVGGGSSEKAVPDLSPQGIPAYPGAIMVSQMDKGAIPVNSLLLATSDPVDKVVEYYRGKLSGWKYGEKYGTSGFWRGADSFNFSSDFMKAIEVVAVMKLDAAIPGVPDDAKTKIQINYK